MSWLSELAFELEWGLGCFSFVLPHQLFLNLDFASKTSENTENKSQDARGFFFISREKRLEKKSGGDPPGGGGAEFTSNDLMPYFSV